MNSVERFSFKLYQTLHQLLVPDRVFLRDVGLLEDEVQPEVQVQIQDVLQDRSVVSAGSCELSSSELQSKHSNSTVAMAARR